LYLYKVLEIPPCRAEEVSDGQAVRLDLAHGPLGVVHPAEAVDPGQGIPARGTILLRPPLASRVIITKVRLAPTARSMAPPTAGIARALLGLSFLGERLAACPCMSMIQNVI